MRYIFGLFVIIYNIYQCIYPAYYTITYTDESMPPFVSKYKLASNLDVINAYLVIGAIITIYIMYFYRDILIYGIINLLCYIILIYNYLGVKEPPLKSDFILTTAYLQILLYMIILSTIIIKVLIRGH